MPGKWIFRKGSKEKGFSYVGTAGKPVRDRSTLARIDSLRIPPAWRDVHIAAGPRGSIQAWGLDARGRKQYRYHPRATQRGELRKYYRVRAMARDLPRLRARIERDFRKGPLTKDRVCAGVLRFISHGFFRVGSERYERENRTFGITTLRKSHATIDGDTVTFEYRGKRGIRHKQPVGSRELVRFIRELKAVPGSRLFRYREDGRWCNLTAHDVNEYLQSVASFPYTAKDFRTWGGTLRAATVLGDLGKGRNAGERKKNVVTAVRLVAAELGNTPAICRKSYVHPVIIARYLQSGATIQSSVSARKAKAPALGFAAHSPEERSLIAFLDEHFPERRTERREE